MTELKNRKRNGKGRKKQTKRIPPYAWESHRTEIEKWYLEEELTQEEVVERLKTEQNFIVNKRQLIHQLGKWGLKKNGKSNSCNDQAVRMQGHEVEHQTNANDTSETLCYAREVLSPKDRGAAAEVHFAVLDDSTAWPLCMDSYAATAQHGPNPGALSSIVLVLSGSAQTPDQATITGHVLDGILQTISSMNDQPTALKCHLLKAHMQMRTGDNVNEILDKLKIDLEHLPRHLEGSDVLTVHLLRALDDHSGGTGHVSAHSNKGFSTLKSCISWSTDELAALSSMPMQLAMLDGRMETEAAIWREETELFFTLWHQWQRLHWNQLEWVEEAESKLGITATELLATVSCILLEDSLDEASDNDDDEDEDEDEDEDDFEYAGDGNSATTKNGQDEYGPQHTSDDAVNQERLLQFARDGAHAIGSRSEEEIWAVFVDTFDRRNTFLVGKVGWPACMIEASGYIGKFVADTIAARTSIGSDQEYAVKGP